MKLLCLYINSILFLVLLSVPFLLPAQVYFGDGNGDFSVFNPENCTASYLHFSGETEVRGWSDIALTPDGKMLGLFDADPDFGIEAVVCDISLSSELTIDTIFYTHGSWASSMVCDKNGKLYVGGPTIEVYEDVGSSLPPVVYRIVSGELFGDLMWWNNKLYGSNGNASGLGTEYVPKFTAYSMDLSESVRLSDSLPPFYALTYYYDRSRREVTHIGSSIHEGPPDFDWIFPSRNTIYRFQIEADTVIGEEYCRFLYQPLNPYISGFTSEDEFRTEYALRLDLDADNSSGRFIDHYEVDSLCTRSFRLADQDVSFYSELGMPDSLVVRIHTPPLGEAVAYLNAPDDTRFRYRGMGSRELVVYPNAVLGWAGWEELVRGLRLNFGSGELLAATRRVDLSFYVDGRHCEPARAFVQVQPEVIPYAGRDSSLLACQRGYDLASLLGEGVFLDGYWSPALAAGGNSFRPWRDTAAVYTYIAQQGDCPADSATISITRAPRPATGYEGNYEEAQVVYLCPGDTAHWTVSDASLDYWSWSDGSEYGSFTVTEPGVHSINAWDTLGCYWFTVASFRNPPEDWDGEGPYLAQDTSIHCQGSTISYQTHLISRDTLLCDTFISTGDCDYLNCRQFLFTQPEVYDTVRICEGEYYLFDQRQLTEAGTYERLLLGESCDTLQLLTLEVNPRYERNLIVGIPPGGSYTVGDSVFTAAGQYRIPLQTEAGCDSIIRLRVEISTATEEAADISCQPGPLLAGGQRDWPVSQPGCVWTKLEVYDVLGRLVYSQKAKGRSASLWPVSAQAGFPAGGYFYRLSTADGIVSGRVVLVR